MRHHRQACVKSPPHSTDTRTVSTSNCVRHSPITWPANPCTRLDVDELWGANGSNEIMLQLFQAFGGPGRTALGADPTYSMYPEYARDTFTGWKLAHRNADFTLNVDKVL